jgi:hypothetical protein
MLQEVIKYMVKQYLYEIGNIAYLKILYMYHRNNALYPLLVMFQHFISLIILALVGPTG